MQTAPTTPPPPQFKAPASCLLPPAISNSVAGPDCPNYLLCFPLCVATSDSSCRRPFLSVGRSISSLWPRSSSLDPSLGELLIQLVFVSIFMSRRNPNTSQSRRTSLESSPTIPSSSLAGRSLCIGELHPPCRCASSVRVGSLDIARQMRRTFVMATVKTCSPVFCRHAAVGHTTRALTVPRRAFTAL
jgi:hypothetical protein